MSEEKVIFISYSTKDTEIADKVRDYIEDNGINCWMAPRDVDTSKSYAQEIMDGLINAKMVLLIFSRDSHDSKYVTEELNNAFIRDKPILPFKIDETLPEGRVEFFLRNQQWLDASSNPEGFFDDLLKDTKRILRGIRSQPVEISLSDKFGSDLQSANIAEVFQNLGSVSKVIMNFDGIANISKDVAGEYLNQKKKKNFSVVEINVSDNVQKAFDECLTPPPPPKRNILPIIAVAAVILIAAVGFMVFSGGDSGDASNQNGVIIDYIELDDDSSKGFDWKYSYFVFGTVSGDLSNKSDYKLHIEFLDDSGKVVKSNDTKVSKIDGSILASAYLDDNNVDKVTAQLLDSDGNVINSTESNMIK